MNAIAEDEVRRHFHMPAHMKGWEAFGTTDAASDVQVRRLGYGHHTSKPVYGTEAWHLEPRADGVGSIEIHSYDTGAYILVCGPNEENVRAAFIRARDAIIAAQSTLWPSQVQRG